MAWPGSVIQPRLSCCPRIGASSRDDAQRSGRPGYSRPWEDRGLRSLGGGIRPLRMGTAHFRTACPGRGSSQPARVAARGGEIAAGARRPVLLVHLPDDDHPYRSQEVLGDQEGKPNASFELGFLENGTFMGYMYIKCGK